jgi:hypothetical protein
MFSALIMPIVSFLFGKPLESVLNHRKSLVEAELANKREMAKSANEANKIKLDGEIRKLEIDLRALEVQGELASQAWSFPAFRFFTTMLVGSVMAYWTLRFASAMLNLASDYNIVIAALNPEETIVSTIVIGFCFAVSRK